MLAFVAVLRTLRRDPRPVAGLVLVSLVSVLTGTVVLSGSIALSHEVEPTSGSAASQALETVVQITLCALVIALVLCARAVALSCGIEIRALEAIGCARVQVVGAGATVIAGALTIGLVADSLFGHAATEWWSAEVAALLRVHPPTDVPLTPAPWVAVALALPAILGWWSGMTFAPREHQTWRRFARWLGAVVLFVTMVLPTALVVAQLPRFRGLVEAQGKEVATGRLDELGTAAAPSVVVSAAAIGMVGAALLVSSDAASLLLAALRRSLPWIPSSWWTGARLARAGCDRFGPIVVITVTTLCLLATRELSQQALVASDSALRGADLRELAVTLGPALLVAAASAVGCCAAQARGTGGAVEHLSTIGMPARTRVASVVIAALAVGGASVIVAAAATVLVAIVGSAAGARVDFLRAAATPVVAGATLSGIAGIVLLFVVNEWVGGVVRRRRS